MASVTVFFADKEIADYPFDKPALVVGRDESSDIRIDNLGISRAHCQFIKRGSTFLLQDMNSANGTFVNGRRVGEHYLNDQDEVVIGKFRLVFHNIEQQSEKAQDHSDIVPDSLNTYVMDGAVIRDKLAQMKAAEGAAAPAEAGSAPVSAAAYAAQMGAAAQASTPAAPAPARAVAAAPCSAQRFPSPFRRSMAII